jgi:DAK2 domain fusion protein YloV
LKDPRENITELTGRQLYYSFLAGAQKIFENQQQINKINVFPVPDADTGTNLASTLQSIVDSPIPTSNIKQTAWAIADAALTGARGNSGIIFAQFLYGFSNEMPVGTKLNVRNFALVMQKASGYTYEAVAKPVDGTMISVIKEWADHIYSVKDKIHDYKKLITDSYHKAKQSLAETTEKLEVLKKNNVVDAGAKGFVVFLEGMIEFFKNGEIRKLMRMSNYEQVEEIKLVKHKHYNYRYCTEAMMESGQVTKGQIQQILEDFGDSVVIAGSPEKMRFHVHTDDPSRLFQMLTELGHVFNQKVDDMVFQDSIAHNRKASIALVTDSSADMPSSYIEQYQIHVIPINLHFGKTHFLDRITITPAQFYDRMDKSPVHPTTSQPSKKEFLNKFNYLSTHYDSIISINIAKELSGTYQNSFHAANEVMRIMGKQITVIDSKNVSAGLGLLLLRTAKAIEQGMSHEEIVSKIQEWIPKIRLYVNIKTLKYFVRGGRVSPMKGFIANVLNLKPIISLDENGKASLFKKSFSRKATINKVLKLIQSQLNENRVWEYAVVYSNREEEENARSYARKLAKVIGKEPLYIESIAPVIGVNAGRGTLAVIVMFE